jgi:hypothetical protein
MTKLNVDIRNLVYKLCERREVPLLVTDIISGYLVHRDLFNINAVSRSLHAQTNAIIYQDVVCDLDGSERSVRRASLLFRTLLTSETAARAVQTLSLAGDPLQKWRGELIRAANTEGTEIHLRGKVPPAIPADLTGFTQKEFVLYGKVAALCMASVCPPSSEIFVGTLYLQLLRFKLHVQDLSVSSDYFRYPDFRDALEEMALDSSIGKLQSCSLCLDLIRAYSRYPNVVEDWNGALLALFTIPVIQSIAAVVSLRPEAVRQLQPGGLSITRLDLHHYIDLASDLSSLLAATPRLRFLKYHARTDYNWLNSSRRGDPILEHSIGLEPLYDALHHVRDSLRELHVSQDVDEDSFYYSPGFGGGYEDLFGRRADLSDLEVLQTLTIPYVALLGYPQQGYAYDWDTILPSSLRCIILNDNLEEVDQDEHWTDETMMPVISQLVKWLSATERGNRFAEFGLRLAKLRTDFNEPVRQELARTCEERGVWCSIEKAHKDYQRSPPRAWFPRGRGRGNLTRGRGRGRGT